jgi:hypothetical protein
VTGTHPGAGDDPVGSVGEEAAKLLGAFGDWAKDQSTGWTSQIDEHLATGAAECQYCPICRTVHVLREASPEVRTQLVTAAASFLQAAAGVMATLGPTATGAERPGNVQHIDLDADADGDADGDGGGADGSWPEESSP